MRAGYARNHSLSIADDAEALRIYWLNKGIVAMFLSTESSTIWMDIKTKERE